MDDYEEGVGKGWRTATIVLSVVLLLFIVGFLWVMNMGTQMIERENKCAADICADEVYASYAFDDYDQTCYCFGADGEVAKTKYME